MVSLWPTTNTASGFPNCHVVGSGERKPGSVSVRDENRHHRSTITRSACERSKKRQTWPIRLIAGQGGIASVEITLAMVRALALKSEKQVSLGLLAPSPLWQ